MGMRITGKLPSGKLLTRLKKSPNSKGNSFQNLSDTAMMSKDASYWKMIREYFKRHPDTRPPQKLSPVITDLKNVNSSKPFIVWFGHSSYLIRFEGKTFLIDPVFSGNAAPLSFMVKAFPGADAYSVSDLGTVDYLILTHDHYDHLDYKTVRELRSVVKHVYCSLGVSAHLIYWGYDENKITELDWWDAIKVDEHIELIAAPARHFSGRGLKRGRTFWSSFILRSDSYRIYLGGDSGYDTHFKLIGEKYGPFDLAILESGQYNAWWPLIHMMPEETAQAAIDLKAKLLLPVHWGKFMLGMHPWDEPIKRVLVKAKELGLEVTTPRIGEPLIPGESIPKSEWWLFR